MLDLTGIDIALCSRCGIVKLKKIDEFLCSEVFLEHD